MTSGGSSTQPLRRERGDDPERQIKFETADHRSRWATFWRDLLRTLTTASTGTPSDGLGDVSEGSTSVPAFLASQKQAGTEKDGGDWFVNEVVVTGDDDQHRHLGSEKGTTTRQSESGAGSMHRGVAGTNESPGSHHYQGGILEWIQWRFWPTVHTFFDPKFEDEERELDFQKLTWYSTKSLSFYASLFLVLNWVMYLVLNHSVTRYEDIAFYGGLSFFTLPCPIMVAANISRKYPVFFQIWFCIATWYCGILEIIQIKQCGFYTHNECHGKDFLAMLYYNTALPTMMLFIVTRRIYNAVAQLSVFVLLLALVIPNQKIFARNVVSFAIFSIFIQGLHYSRELTERRMYMLNTQLKVAYRAQQKAQIAESKASLAKRRFASYIFHEVRVPLNTAMLAYQNLRSSNAFKDEYVQDHNNVEVYALEASLTMMQQVLNDVLDLQKMDAGRFESSPRPFPLHRAINSIMGPIGVATSAKGLKLRVELDDRIDKVPCQHVAAEGLWVIGDEIRLRQVLTNLASNAVKFTPECSGEIRVTTKLLAPLPEAKAGSSKSTPEAEEVNPLVSAAEQRHDIIVFRLEVQDSGPGIRPSDLVDNRLFQPFVQTHVGKMSGNGSGLGLAIVQQIVSLSGGRLGVQSRKGRGATFWVEFAYPIATSADVQGSRNAHALTPTPPVSRSRQTMPEFEPESYAAFSSSIESDTAFRLALPSLKQHGPLPLSTPHPLQENSRISMSRASFSEASSSSHPLQSSSAFSPLSGDSGVSTSSHTEGPLRVLVVDDDAMTRTLMTRMLTKLGCVVDTAADGQECLDILLKPPPDGNPLPTYDLISLDNHMPIMTGEEAVRHLRSLGRTDLVVGCTGNALSDDQKSYISAGADRVLTKPIMLKDLKAVLQVALQRRLQKDEPIVEISPPS
ncbi:hypothetical protein JAAARDRAFT_696446 [Jaapia argillacea MUCL 33604]|uniref:histidine kinase n=1 Tax=Jaapia argillacea MUCL 33604 TaxID=933084 RepID=A0A067PVU7_9AGAM|nr:hypothetical protein JAAARDRAFT_696446 [Jaapia argillacea MUCL 33604]